MASKHIKASGVKRRVAAEYAGRGYSKARLARIEGGAVHNSAAKASPKAKKANPRLANVRGVKKSK